METFIMYFVLFIVLCLVGIFFLNSLADGLNEDQGFSSNAVNLTHIGGASFLGEGEGAQIGVKKDRLLINHSYYIMLDRVKKVECVSEIQLVEKQKSVIQRALAGGLLVGPIGAIIGGISGVGTSTRNERQYFLSIEYLSKDGEEVIALFHIGDIVERDVRKFIVDVNEKVGYVPEKEASILNQKEV